MKRISEDIEYKKKIKTHASTNEQNFDIKQLEKSVSSYQLEIESLKASRDKQKLELENKIKVLTEINESQKTFYKQTRNYLILSQAKIVEGKNISISLHKIKSSKDACLSPIMNNEKVLKLIDSATSPMKIDGRPLDLIDSATSPMKSNEKSLNKLFSLGCLPCNSLCQRTRKRTKLHK
jgi:hypothetical protein